VCLSFMSFIYMLKFVFNCKGKRSLLKFSYVAKQREIKVVGVRKMCDHSLRQNMTNIFTSMIGFVVIYATDDYMTMLSSQTRHFCQ
jgi:hypothetical protein